MYGLSTARTNCMSPYLPNLLLETLCCSTKVTILAAKGTVFPSVSFFVFRRNSTDIKDFLEQADILKEKLSNWGYPRKLIKESFKRARYFNRDAMFQTNEIRPMDKLVCVTKHSNINHKLRQTINSCWYLLNMDNGDSKLPKTLFAFKRNKNLKNHLVKGRTQESSVLCQKSICGLGPIKGNHRFGTCQACPNAIVGDTINTLEQKVSLQGMTNCCTSNIVYIIMCPCDLIYVEETGRECRTRIGGTYIEHSY